MLSFPASLDSQQSASFVSLNIDVHGPHIQQEVERHLGNAPSSSGSSASADPLVSPENLNSRTERTKEGIAQVGKSNYSSSSGTPYRQSLTTFDNSLNEERPFATEQDEEEEITPDSHNSTDATSLTTFENEFSSSEDQKEPTTGDATQRENSASLTTFENEFSNSEEKHELAVEDATQRDDSASLDFANNKTFHKR